MKELPKIYVDYDNLDYENMVRLNLNGTFRDIEEQGIVLVEGMEIIVYNEDDLSTKGIVHFSTKENIWVAQVNWDSF